jgi:glycosyltransferase involved in cell wall biosynthesis
LSVTILIPAYNAGPFLHRAIRSALDQTLPPLEVLVVDDASTDETLDVAHGFSRSDPRVRVLSMPENGGAAQARNAGLDAARGEWIAVLDADDAFIPERLAHMAQVAAATRADVVLDNFAYYSAATGRVGVTALAPGVATEAVDVYRFASRARPNPDGADWGLLKPMFRRSFLDGHGLRYLPAARHGQDYLLMMQVLLAGAQCVLSHRPGYLYTERSSGMSRTRIDYDGVARRTADLMEDERVRRDQRLKGLLQIRIEALKPLSREQNVRTYWKDGDLGRLIAAGARDPQYAATIVQLGFRKLATWAARR